MITASAGTLLSVEVDEAPQQGGLQHEMK